MSSQETDKKQDIFSLRDTNALKGLAIILMFYHHLFAFPERLPKGIRYEALFELSGVSSAYAVAAIGKICVAIFVFLGGYGTYLSCTRSESFRTVVGKRARSMYSALWSVFAVFIPLCIIFDIDRVTANYGDMLLNFLGLKTSYNREWWFFAPYLILILFIPIIKKLADKSRNLAIGLAAVCIVTAFSEFAFPYLTEISGLVGYERSLLYVLMKNTLKILPGFMGGCVFARYDLLTKIKTRFSGNAGYSIGALVLTAAVVCVRAVVGENFDYLLVMLFVPSITVALNNKVGRYIHSFFNIIGKESTDMWLVHSFYCFYIFPKAIYAPYYTPLIAVWLLLISFASSKILTLIRKGIGVVAQKAKKKLTTKKA